MKHLFWIVTSGAMVDFFRSTSGEVSPQAHTILSSDDLDIYRWPQLGYEMLFPPGIPASYIYSYGLDSVSVLVQLSMRCDMREVTRYKSSITY